MKNIIVFGSTGSIGTQTLDVIRNSEDVNVVGLTGYNNIELLSEQIKEFNPEVVAVKDENKAIELKKNVDKKIEILYGEKGLQEIAQFYNADLAVIAIEGIAGLIPTVKAIESGKNIALANKETLVSGGELVTSLVKEKGVKFLPIDSEHCAILQCLQGNKINSVSRLILTASGGPFRGMKKKELKYVTVEQALNHPNWKMGKKITIDSATLMNKGFEVIEARWFFDVPVDKIDVIIHPQSIIHSLVEYVDGSIIAQLASADMRIPIQYAINYPNRNYVNGVKFLDFAINNNLSFEMPDKETFKCLSLAYEAIKIGGTMTTVLNAADEIAVSLFLNKKIGFLEIPEIIESCMEEHNNIEKPSLNDIIEIDKNIRSKLLKDYMR